MTVRIPLSKTRFYIHPETGKKTYVDVGYVRLVKKVPVSDKLKLNCYRKFGYDLHSYWVEVPIQTDIK